MIFFAFKTIDYSETEIVGQAFLRRNHIVGVTAHYVPEVRHLVDGIVGVQRVDGNKYSLVIVKERGFVAHLCIGFLPSLGEEHQQFAVAFRSVDGEFGAKSLAVVVKPIRLYIWLRNSGELRVRQWNNSWAMA